MRILSQDGIKFDIEYENCNLVVNKKCCEIEAETSNPNFTPVMASYSSIEKCRKAMDMLHIAYAGKFITNADISDDFNEQLKEMMKGGFGTVIVKDIGNCRMEFNNLNGYFQFPADDEIEV